MLSRVTQLAQSVTVPWHCVLLQYRHILGKNCLTSRHFGGIWIGTGGSEFLFVLEIHTCKVIVPERSLFSVGP